MLLIESLQLVQEVIELAFSEAIKGWITDQGVGVGMTRS